MACNATARVDDRSVLAVSEPRQRTPWGRWRLSVLRFVSWWQIGLAVGGVTGRHQTPPFELCVQLGAPESYHVGETQPYEERDHPTKRSVGLVVGGELPT